MKYDFKDCAQLIMNEHAVKVLKMNEFQLKSTLICSAALLLQVILLLLRRVRVQKSMHQFQFIDIWQNEAAAANPFLEKFSYLSSICPLFQSSLFLFCRSNVRVHLGLQLINGYRCDITNAECL